MKRRSPRAIEEETIRGAVLGIRLSAFINGSRDFRRSLNPERRALRAFCWAGGRLVLSILDDLVTVYEILDPEGGWSSRKLEGLPKIGVANVWPPDVEAHESNGDLLANMEGPVTPPTFMLLKRDKAWQVLRRAPEPSRPMA